jgi:methionyl aminopeptidase
MIELKSPSERDALREAGRVVAEVLALLKASVAPGVATRDLDRLAEAEIRRRGADPVFKGYQGHPSQPPYPATVCVSVNDEVVHGIPGARRLQPGDLVSLDLGARVRGMVGDGAVSVFCGNPPDERAAKLLEVTARALDAGVRAAVVGGHVGDIGAAVAGIVEAEGFSVVRDFVGHGVGRAMHEDPQVPNYGVAGRGPVLKAGMALAIEPMVNVGDWRVAVKDDGWTVVTADRSLSCHFEHSVFIAADGTEVLTRVAESGPDALQ